MWGIQHRSPRTKNRWWWTDCKDASDPAEHNKKGGRLEARWIYPTQELALKWGEHYRSQAWEDSEWRIVPIKMS